MRVVAVSMAYEYRKPEKLEDNLNYIENIFKDIKNIKPDFVVLPENFAYTGIKFRDIGKFQKIKNFLKNISKKTNCWVAGSSYDVIDKKIFNRCFFLNRKGDIVGKYDKVHPTEGELERGIYPGDKNQLPVETEFGEIGAFICFDANWHYDLKYQIDNGAKLLVFSSAYPAGKILNSISLLYQVFIVAGIWTLHSGIIDNTGRWLKKTDRFSYWVWEDINLERTVFHWDFEGVKVKEIVKRYKDRVKIETFGDEALFTIEVLDKSISIKDIIKEFNLVTYRDYKKRAEEKQDEKRFDI
ncbi:MAG: carbon-nitrogen hydrolase family protein [Candidatus Omnitrophica bacterium]|nr:carbon-nitrogen hydrolase family protein [Candidatus Omnitrophota bacterium]